MQRCADVKHANYGGDIGAVGLHHQPQANRSATAARAANAVKPVNTSQRSSGRPVGRSVGRLGPVQNRGAHSYIPRASAWQPTRAAPARASACVLRNSCFASPASPLWGLRSHRLIGSSRQIAALTRSDKNLSLAERRQIAREAPQRPTERGAEADAGRPPRKPRAILAATSSYTPQSTNVGAISSDAAGEQDRATIHQIARQRARARRRSPSCPRSSGFPRIRQRRLRSG